MRRSEKERREETMKKLPFLALVALLMAATSAYAQVAAPGQSGGSPEKWASVEGEIRDLDLAHGTLTLQDGEQFTLPPSVAESGFPQAGQHVKVTYDEQGGQKVVRELDIGFGSSS